MRVLLVDKNVYDLEAMCLALTSPDIEVQTSHDGDRALLAAMGDPPSVVVAASSLGQMGGFALSRELKMLHDRGDIPYVGVVVLLERDVDEWLARWSRCDAYRTKPVDLDELELLVRELGTRPQPASV
ncbi:MAG TPA: hypothetical protein VM840_12030 [Actinomycetota bacterium]|nr:hypothetical protein [Actinomycetota bacterium]